LRVTLFGLAATLVLVPFSYLLIAVVSEGPLIRLDKKASGPLNEIFARSETLETIAKVVSFLGSPPWFYLTVGAATLFFWRRGDKRISIFLVVTNLMGGVIDTAVKVIVARPRPELESALTHAVGKSFPSGHTMASTVGYGALLLAFMPLIPRRARAAVIVGYLLIVALIGGSRLALGVHFISDVLGGFILGLAWLALSTAAFSIWRQERGKPPVEVTEGIEPEAG
jgi:undecaprenyl-diphosphatase